MLTYLINGISLGSIYAIIALGYTMVYGIAKMLNFAHGDVIMIGGYMAFCSTSYLGWPPLVCVAFSMFICTILGIVIERLAYKPLRSAPALAVLITAIGVSYFLQNAALLIWSSNPKAFPNLVKLPNFSLGSVQVSAVSYVTIIACIAIMAGLTFFTGKTKMGKAMRAVSEDKGAAQLMGINVNATISLTFDICNRFRTGSDCRGSALFSLSHFDANNRLHAGYQSLYSCCIRRDRIYSRCHAWRCFAWHY